jgi:acyl-coenzyme A synthetase/AMP-(fatty) acid ligase
MTAGPYNIARAFAEVAQANANLPAIIGQSEVLSYDDLWRLVQRIAARMQADGVGAESLVAVNLSEIRFTLGCLLATALLGAGYVVAGPGLAKSEAVQPTHFYRTPEMSGHRAVNFRAMDSDWFGTDDGASPTRVETNPNRPWLYLHTSGTTGTPKYLALTQSMIRDRSAAAAIDFPYRQTTFASFFGVASRPFFARALAAFFQAGSIVEGIDFGLWQASGVNFVCGSPLQVIQALGDNVLSPRINRLEVSGARLPDGAVGKYLRSFRQVVDVYGASETSKSFATDIGIGPDGKLTFSPHVLDSEVEIVEPDGQPCGVGKFGAVRVRNSYMVSGYVGAPELSAKCFRGGWFYPGDLARWGEAGELVVIGREDMILNIHGYKINAELLEAVIKTVAGVEDVICFQNPVPRGTEPVICFLILAPENHDENTVEAVMNIAANRLGHVFARKNMRLVKAFPRGPDGRPDRKACQAMVLRKATIDGEMR